MTSAATLLLLNVASQVGGVARLTDDGQKAASTNLSDVTQGLVAKAAADALPSTLGFASGLMVMALVAHIILEVRKVQTGQRPDYARAIAVVLVHVLLLVQYPAFSSFVLNLAAGVTRGGQINGAELQGQQAHALAARYAKFQKGVNGRALTRAIDEAKVPSTGNDTADNIAETAKDTAASLFDKLAPDFLTTSPSVFIDRLFENLADIVMGLIFVLTSAIVLLLSVVQKAALVLLIAAGPIIIVLSAFPGPTSGFLFSWVLGVFEVSMWGFTTRLLSTLLTARFGAVPDSVTGGSIGDVVAGDAASNFGGYFENIAFCGVLAGAYTMVPVLTSGLFRGGLASQGGQMLGQATGFVAGVATGRVGGASGHGGGALAGGGGGGGGGDGGGDAGGGGRAGDEGVAPTAPMSKGQAIAKQRAIANNTSRAGD